MTRWPTPFVVAVGTLVVGILLVELGVRQPAHGPQAVEVPMPALLRPGIERLRATAEAAGASAGDAAVTSGVVFGRTEHVTPEDEEAFLGSGLWHLLAASGQNVALVIGCSLFAVRMVRGSRTLGVVLALLAVPGYVLVVGGGASIVRAGIMGELALVAWLAGRLGDGRQMLVVAAAGITLAWPGAHRGLGMQLSFACVVALMRWVGPCTRALERRGMPTWLATGLAASAVCSAATAPILLLRTGAAPCTGVLANVVAVPIAGAILVLGLAGAACALLAGAVTGAEELAARICMAPAGLLAGMLRAMAHRAAAWPMAQTTSPWLAIGLPVAFAMAMSSGTWTRLRRAAGWVAVGCVVVPAALALAARSPAAHWLPGAPPPLAPGSLRIAVLDIGQGDATLLQAGGHSLLVDTGPPDGRVVERVHALGVTRVDGIVLTHDSLDHRGGFDAAYAALRPGWVARPAHAPGPWQRIEQRAGRLADLCAGDSLDVGTIHLDVLHPRCDGMIAPKTGDLHNDGALVLLVTHGAVRAVLPADAEAPVLVDLPIPAPLDLLRISHHGSADDALPRLLERVRPAAAAISVGEGNDYGHPTPQTLADLRAAGVETWRTDRDGTVVFDSDGRHLQVHG